MNVTYVCLCVGSMYIGGALYYRLQDYKRTKLLMKGLDSSNNEDTAAVANNKLFILY